MLRQVVERYVWLHQSTGYSYRKHGYILRSFCSYAEERGDQFVRTNTAIAWARLGPTANARQSRLRHVRHFARLMHAEDARHEIPPDYTFGPMLPRRRPHIFSAREINSLLQGAAALGPPGSLRPRVYTTLFGLLAVTGLRISEALALDLADVTADGLVIRDTKFRKSRLIPLHDSTREALDRYLLARTRCAADNDAVFLSVRGTRLGYQSSFMIFRQIVGRLKIGDGAFTRRPRLHDFRHTFAVRSIEDCAWDREALARHMLSLSTYLGHARLSNTYWYLQATPRLLAEIAARTEALAGRRC